MSDTAPKTVEEYFAEALDETPAEPPVKPEAAPPAPEMTAPVTPEAAPPAPPAEAPPELSPLEQLRAENTALMAKLDAERAALKTETEKAQRELEAFRAGVKEGTKPAKAETTPAADPLTQLSDPEKQALEYFQENYAPVRDAMQVELKVFAQRLVPQIVGLMEQVRAEILAQVQPYMHATQSVAASSFDTQVLGRHPTYHQVKPLVEQWIESRPAWIRKAYKDTWTNGDAPSVIALLDEYMSNTTPPQPAAVVKDQQQRAEALQTLKPVESRRTTVAAKPDPTDVEAAWKDALAEFDKESTSRRR